VGGSRPILQRTTAVQRQSSRVVCDTGTTGINVAAGENSHAAIEVTVKNARPDPAYTFDALKTLCFN
jgi:hypothetical protein